MCKDCAERRKLARDAFLKAKFKEAAGHVVKGAAELVGAKPKTGASEARKSAKKNSRA